MVYGIGCDLCSIARMEKSLLGPHGAVFARRVFGPAEQAALGLPLAEEEETARRTAHTVASAAAAYHFSGRSAQWVEARRLRAHLSLSHEDGMAMAYCILETET